MKFMLFQSQRKSTNLQITLNQTPTTKQPKVVPV